MGYKKQAEVTFHKFSKLEGNQHIASDYGLEFILKIVNDFKVKNILEVGLGIGSISDAILNYANSNNFKINYTGTEANDFCLNSLKTNVDFYNKINLQQSLINFESVNLDQKFDFVIIDGSDDALTSIKHLITENAMIFIEGGRKNQLDSIKQIYPNAISTEIISSRKPPVYSPFNNRNWSGGGSLIFVNPTLKQNLYSKKERLKTILKRRILRKIK